MVATDYEGMSAPDSATIWRYMSLVRFQDLVQRGLYFAAAHQFDDAFEGSITSAELLRRRAHVERVFPDDDGVQADMLKLQSRAFADLRRMTKVNCWHASEHENIAMWERYLRRESGVAVVSTVHRLKTAMRPFRLQPQFGEETVRVGRVRYLDFEAEEMVDSSMLGIFLHKRLEFRDEREVRALLSLRMASEYGVSIPTDGAVVEIDPEVLIERVVVWPAATKAEIDRVRSLVASIGLSSSVEASRLARPPTY